MSSQEKVMITVFIGVVIGIAVPLVDRVFAEARPLGQGSVIQKQYVAANRSSGITYRASGQDESPMYVDRSSPEQWIVLVKQGGEVFSVNVPPAVWESLEAGSPVEVNESVGRIFSYGKTLRAYKE